MDPMMPGIATGMAGQKAGPTNYTASGLPGLTGGFAYPPGSEMCRFIDNLNGTVSIARMAAYSPLGGMGGMPGGGGAGLSPGGAPSGGVPGGAPGGASGGGKMGKLLSMLAMMLQSLTQLIQKLRPGQQA